MRLSGRRGCTHRMRARLDNHRSRNDAQDRPYIRMQEYRSPAHMTKNLNSMAKTEAGSAHNVRIARVRFPS